YGENMRHGRLPYRDFFEEYPPGALPAFVLPAVLPGASFTLWSKALQWLLAACCIVFAAVTLRTDRWRAALIGLTPALLGQVTFTRFDFWPAALTAAALAAIVARRHRIALALLAVAVAAKEYPLVLLPMFLLVVDRRAGRREAKIAAAIFAAVLAAIVLPFAALGPGGVRYSLEVQFRRPLQVESLGASLLLALHRLGAYTPHVVSTYGSQNLSGGTASAIGVLTTAVELAAIVAVWAAFARGPRDDSTLFAAAAASVLAFLALGKVLSPQYVVWIAALVPLALRSWRLVLLGLAVGLTQVWSQGRYHEVTAGRPIVWAVLARNLALVLLYVLTAATVARRARAPSTASPAAQSVNSSGSPA
ncbi:MAG TPA: glycosyltransferase 87 family protein, partial [Gaiellaceae bacterium]|nr:glycosyltransferase 87 family protein [Gaiellaceae bacterium]